MEVKLTSAIYFGITLGFLIGFIWDLAQETGGGWISSGKRRGEIGCLGATIALIWVVFSLIWGGFFWW